MADAVKILVVDDELAIQRFLKASFDPADYEVAAAMTGEEGIRKAALFNPGVVLLDLGLPDMEGLQVAEAIREWSSVPIIVLSVRGQEQDKVAALDAGVDDYLTKPFGVGELMARIRVALRHAGKTENVEPKFEFSGLSVDLATRHVMKDGQEVHLTPNEYGILALLVRNAGKVVTHRQILKEVWGPAYEQESHYLRVYMGQLRHKLEEDAARPKLLITESGVGYRLLAE